MSVAVVAVFPAKRRQKENVVPNIHALAVSAGPKGLAHGMLFVATLCHGAGTVKRRALFPCLDHSHRATEQLTQPQQYAQEHKAE